MGYVGARICWQRIKEKGCFCFYMCEERMNVKRFDFEIVEVPRFSVLRGFVIV